MTTTSVNHTLGSDSLLNPQVSQEPTPATTSASTETQTTGLAEALSDALRCLGFVQTIISKAGVTNTQVQSALASATAQIQQQQLSQAQHNAYKESHRPWWKIMFDVIFDVVAVVVTVFNPGVGITMLVMNVLTQTGAFSDLTKLIADALEKDGLGPDAAQEIASLVIFVAVASITLMVTPECEGRAANSIFGHGFKEGLKNAFLKFFSFCGRNAPELAALINGFQTSGVVTNTANLMVDEISKNNDVLKAKVDEIVSIITGVLCSIIGIGLLGSVMTAPKGALPEDPALLAGLKKLFNRMLSGMEATTVNNLSIMSKVLMFTGGASGSIASGAWNVYQGQLVQDLGNENATVALCQAILGADSANMSMTNEARSQASMTTFQSMSSILGATQQISSSWIAASHAI